MSGGAQGICTTTSRPQRVRCGSRSTLPS